MKHHRLHFSIGPVQGFVGQSRRTRDLWGSSFLLSYLAGNGLHAVLSSDDYEARDILPAVRRREDERGDGPYLNDLYAAIAEGNREGPRHGTIPNRFVVDVEAPERAAEDARDAIESAWDDVVERIRRDYVEPVFDRGLGSDNIWDRQTDFDNFWEVYWAVGDEPVVLDRRKNWRTRFPRPEPGDKGTMMHRWQELSGRTRARSGGDVDDLWDAMREPRSGVPPVTDLDLVDHERLSALGLVKRLFPKRTGNGDDEIVGWNLETLNWPSTAYMAAAPWIEHVCEQAADAGDTTPADYAKVVRNATRYDLAEKESAIDSLARWSHDTKCIRQFPFLDGNFFFDDAVDNDNTTPLAVEEGDESDVRDALIGSLRGDFYKNYGEPSRFYAMLTMDGDNMGKLLGEADAEDRTREVSRALGNFAASVDDIVGAHDGVTVYAGGDDVLALVSLPQVFQCAAALRESYLEHFEGVADDFDATATVSAGIAFAHYKYPLTEVYDAAEHLLDDVAKGQTGRDSLAVNVLKPGGEQYEWSMPWTWALLDRGESPEDDSISYVTDPSDSSPVTIIDELIERYRRDHYTTSFIYGLRDLFMLWSDDPQWSPGQTVSIDDALEPADLMEAEHRSQSESDADFDVSEAVALLDRASRRVERRVDASGRVSFQTTFGEDDRRQIGFDAPLLVRFLAQQQEYREVTP